MIMGPGLQQLAERKCVPCRANLPPIPAADVERWLRQLPGWEPDGDDRKIRKRYRFGDFGSALAFVNQLAVFAEEQDHHPDVEFGWGYAHITWTTHSIKGLSENDFVMAARTDLLFQDAPGRRSA